MRKIKIVSVLLVLVAIMAFSGVASAAYYGDYGAKNVYKYQSDGYLYKYQYIWRSLVYNANSVIFKVHVNGYYAYNGRWNKLEYYDWNYGTFGVSKTRLKLTASYYYNGQADGYYTKYVTTNYRAYDYNKYVRNPYLIKQFNG